MALDRTRLVDDIVTAVRERIPLYRNVDIVDADDLKRSIADNLDDILATLADPQHTRQLRAAEQTGRLRAQQRVPLPDVLNAFAIGIAVLHETLASHDADVAGQLWRHSAEQALAVTAAHRAATTALVAAQERHRAGLVDALFTGQVAAAAGPWEIGKMLGLAPGSHLVVVVAQRGAGIEPLLAQHGIVSAWQTAPATDAGVVSLLAGQHDVLLRVLRDAGVRAGISPVYHHLTDTPRALHLARTALAEIPAGRCDIREFSDSPLAGLVAHDPDEGRRLAREVFGAVLELPAEDRDGLLDTLRTFLAEGGSMDRTARVMHCHPNTVRYRLNRIAELTGRSLNEPRTMAELVTAAYALSANDGGRQTRIWPHRTTG